MDSSGDKTPGAIVPFCAYAGNLSTLGQQIAGMDFPICDKFQATVLDGQVCYVLNMEALPRGATENGKDKGLLLALNMNVDTKEEISDSEEEWFDKDILKTEASGDINSATVHLSTLDRFSITKPGKYAMASLKKMTGTTGFVDLPDNIKDCQIEAQEICYNRRYIEELQNQCNCLPWALGADIRQKVTTIHACILFKSVKRGPLRVPLMPFLPSVCSKNLDQCKYIISHSLILSREGLILTLSILPCPQGWIS